MAAETPPAVLFWVQHLLGIGHFARTAALARAAAAQRYAAHIANGGPDVPGIDTGAAALHPLPGRCGSADESFSSLVNERGAPAGEDDWRQRSDRLAAILSRVRPQLVVLEHYPFGRRAFRQEIETLLDNARALGVTGVAVSVRDILVARAPQRWAEATAFIERHIDRVFVHGDPAFIALEETFPLAARIASKLHYTGYVDPRPAEAPTAGAGRSRKSSSAAAAGAWDRPCARPLSHWAPGRTASG